MSMYHSGKRYSRRFHLRHTHTAMPYPFATRLDNVETSAIRELFKVLGRPGIISFAGGFPDSALFDVEGIARAAAAALATEPAAALQYCASEGYAPLREEIARLMRASAGAPEVQPQQLMVTTGSQQALDLLGKILLEPGSTALVEAPTFLAAIQCFRLYGARVIGVPINADGVQPEALEALIAQHKPRLVYLITNFGNPSGATLTLERRLRVLEIAARTRTLMVEDDPYGALYFDAPPPPSLLALSAQVPGSRDYVAYCGSLSKTLSPGLRLGWMVAPPDLLARAVMCKQFADANTSAFAQATAAHYLASGALPAHLDKVRPAYAARAAAMSAALHQHCGAAASFTAPQGGLFTWVRFAPGGAPMDAAALAKRGIELGVAFVPGAPFYCDNPDTATARLSYATASPDTIREGVARIAKALRE